jgi:hypothetical protein
MQRIGTPRPDFPERLGQNRVVRTWRYQRQPTGWVRHGPRVTRPDGRAWHAPGTRRALRANPSVNVSFAGDKLLRHRGVHLGVAVDGATGAVFLQQLTSLLEQPLRIVA